MNWHYANDGKQFGPVSDSELAQLALTGVIKDDTLLWRDGLPGWQPYRELKASLAPAPLVPPMVLSAGGPAGAVSPGANEVVCNECQKWFSKDNAISYGTVWVCATCKPIFIQKLKEGAPGPAAVLPGAVPQEYAGFWIRFAARFIDGLIEGVVLGIPMVVLFFAAMGGMQPRGGQPSPNQLAAQGLMQAASLLFSVAYNTFFIGRYGATPGKMAVGVKVVTPEGDKVTYGRAFGRAWADRLSSILCLFFAFPYLMVVFDDQKRALHDHMCSTRVVYK
jgi:uncharacterized RDD family membrane protein YckC